MIPRSVLPLGLLVLLSACVQPEPQAYMPPYRPPPEPYFPPPRPVARPLPLLVPVPETVAAPEPLLPPAPSDPIDIPSTAFFPVDTGPVPEAAPAAPVPRPAPAEPAAAVPFMGFRPMKGQTRALP